MDSSTAERWVVVSALIVIAVYGYRRIIEPVQQGNIKNIVGIGNPVPLAQFMTAWGFVYFCLGIAANASPGLGGSMAILIATGDLLTNAPAVLGDVTKQEQPTTPNPNAAAAAANAAHGDQRVTGVFGSTNAGTPPAKPTGHLAGHPF